MTNQAIRQLFKSYYTHLGGLLGFLEVSTKVARDYRYQWSMYNISEMNKHAVFRVTKWSSQVAATVGEVFMFQANKLWLFKESL